MVILLYGPDDYRREQKKREIVATYERKHPVLGRAAFTAETELDADRFAEFCATSSLFTPVRLATVGGAFAAPDDVMKKFAAVVRDVAANPSTVLLFSESSAPPKPFHFFRAAGSSKRSRTSRDTIVQKFDYLVGPAWHAFVRAEALSRGIPLDSDAVRLLADLYERDAWRLTTELDKLRHLARLPRARRDFESLGLIASPDGWGLIWGLRSSSRAERLGNLEQLLLAGEPAAKIFHIAAYQSPRMLHEAAGKDAAVKSGALEYEEALTALVL